MGESEFSLPPGEKQPGQREGWLLPQQQGSLALKTTLGKEAFSQNTSLDELGSSGTPEAGPCTATAWATVGGIDVSVSQRATWVCRFWKQATVEGMLTMMDPRARSILGGQSAMAGYGKHCPVDTPMHKGR